MESSLAYYRWSFLCINLIAASSLSYTKDPLKYSYETAYIPELIQDDMQKIYESKHPYAYLSIEFIEAFKTLQNVLPSDIYEHKEGLKNIHQAIEHNKYIVLHNSAQKGVNELKDMILAHKKRFSNTLGDTLLHICECYQSALDTHGALIKLPQNKRT